MYLISSNRVLASQQQTESLDLMHALQDFGRSGLNLLDHHLE